MENKFLQKTIHTTTPEDTLGKVVLFFQIDPKYAFHNCDLLVLDRSDP